MKRKYQLFQFEYVLLTKNTTQCIIELRLKGLFWRFMCVTLPLRLIMVPVALSFKLLKNSYIIALWFWCHPNVKEMLILLKQVNLYVAFKRYMLSCHVYLHVCCNRVALRIYTILLFPLKWLGNIITFIWYISWRVYNARKVITFCIWW